MRSPDSPARRSTVGPGEADAAVRREGSPWWLRLSQEPCADAHARDDTETDADWQRWRTAVDPDDAGLFDRRLDWDGLTPGSARAILAGGSPQKEPDWGADFELIRAVARKAAEPFLPMNSRVAFAEVLQPGVDWAWDRLRARVSPEAMAALEPQARTDLRDGLLRRLSEVCGQALYADFRTTRAAGQNTLLELGVGTSISPGRAGYEVWCRETLRSGYELVLARFPVLGRLLTVVVHQWIETTAQLLMRVHRDRARILERFEIPVVEPMSRIRLGLGDPHRGGRSVALLSFGSESTRRQLVYKPKDLHIEQHYQAVLRHLDAWTGRHPTAAVDVLACGTEYGYASFVKAVPCASAEELHKFYRSAGRLLAALYLLGATDAHFENLIATGPDLVLVDPETLLQGTVTAAVETSRAAADPTEAAFTQSVMRVGMLPSWVVGGTDHQAHDLSALGVAAGQPSVQAGWADVNTDRMAWGPCARHAPPRPSLPVPADAANPLRDHVEDVVSGFAETYRAAAAPANRHELLDLLAGFAGASRRLVLRATKVYATIQRRALSGISLASANHRVAELERLTRSALVTGQRAPHWQVFHAELRDMEDLDVPFFDHAVGSFTVRSSIGPIEGLLVTDGLAEARERVLSLSDDDLAWQVRLIRMSVRARFAVLRDRADEPRVESATSVASTRAAAPAAPAAPDGPAGAIGDGRGRLDGPAAARQILSGIEDDAIVDREGDGRTWLVLSLLPDARHVQLAPVNHSLYDGRIGISVFLELARRAGIDAASVDLDSDLIAPIFRALDPQRPYDRYRYLRDLGPGLLGVGGLLRGLQILDPSVVPTVCAGLDPGLIARVGGLDLLGGCAGLVAPLLRHQHRAGDDWSRRLIEAAARRLVDEQLPNGGWPSPLGERPLTGMSHGASGTGLALLRAGAALGESEWVGAGARAFGYEAQLFDEAAGNWPDLREPPAGQTARVAPMVAWCHGAPGIGLARLEALDILPDHPDSPQWRRDLEVAMATTARAPRAGADHLCCGTIGRAAILRIGAARRNRADWAVAADQLTRSVLSDYGAAGRFGLPLADPDGSHGASPGLMTGTSGIGAHLVTRMTGDHLGALLS